MKQEDLAIIATVVAVGIIPIVLIVSNSQTHEVVSQEPSHVIASVLGPEDMYSRPGVTHYIDTGPTTTVHIKRGTTIKIPVVLKHWTKASGESITLTNFHDDVSSFVVAPTANMSDYDRSVLLSKGSPIPGEIPMKDYVTVSPSTITINANSSATVIVNISIPSTFPDAALNQQIAVSMGFTTNLPDSIVAKKGIGRFVIVEQ